MSDSVLSKLVSNDTKNTKTQEEQTKLLRSIVDNQNKILGVEKKRLDAEKRTAQKTKRSGGDRKGVLFDPCPWCVASKHFEGQPTRPTLWRMIYHSTKRGGTSGGRL